MKKNKTNIVLLDPVQAGRLGGLVGGLSTSAAKQQAARKNGKRGGRPLKADADPLRRERYLKWKLNRENQK